MTNVVLQGEQKTPARIMVDDLRDTESICVCGVNMHNKNFSKMCDDRQPRPNCPGKANCRIRERWMFMGKMQ
jgi:hypothetical protein